jgi:hypothetical protein
MPRYPQNAAAIAALNELKRLPVFADLHAALGPGHSPYIDGTPVTLSLGRTRMCWVWFPGGVNNNFAVDHAATETWWRWRIAGQGPAGHCEKLSKDPAPPAEDMIRAVAAGAGLLGYTPPGPAYDRGQVEAALANAADLVADGLGLDERDRDLIFLIRAAEKQLAADPAVTLDQVIERTYDESAAEVRSWWTGWGSSSPELSQDTFVELVDRRRLRGDASGDPAGP